MTPRQYSSGEVDRHGSISKMGPAECRSMLYEAAQTMLTVTKRTFRGCPETSKFKNWGCEEKRNEKSNCSSSKKISCNYA
ncbi:transposase [Wolbachia endosymbiont (group A) of Ischnus inquisitorius]|uniref:transposase n=1 Tax=Wolbachia endosymbiont (group A) of Ischnus inquisitorius TaxID=3077922 RepID=UPI0031334362